MRPDPLDTLKYLVMIANLLLAGQEDAEQFLDDMDWLVKPYGEIDESTTYGNGMPVVTRHADRSHYNLPPGFVAGARS